MFPPVGYALLEKLYEGASSEVWRARREADGLAVILKALKDDYPLPSERARYRQEFVILRDLQGVGAVQVYDLIDRGGRPALALEDIGGRALTALLTQGPLSLRAFLRLAIPIAAVVNDVHRRNVIHKDISPANIIVAECATSDDDRPAQRSDAVRVKLIDFGLATRLSRETPALKRPEMLEGTLAYISPEQTGRMNRSVDYRADLYSVGVTLYELLTGRLPFAADDALELVHSHIARRPPSPAALAEQGLLAASQLPPGALQLVSAIIMKLLAKDAEDRYQSAFGLGRDLERALELTEAAERAGWDAVVRPFELAQHDAVSRLQIPQRLYGREPDVARLLATFERVAAAGQAELLLVAGNPGVGKSSLVHELHKPMTAQRGYFIAGKFDQLQRTIPYAALTQAFNQLCRQLLTEPAAALKDWRRRILEAVGPNAPLLCEVIPDLALLIGAQPQSDAGSRQELQHRLNFAFGNLLQAICGSDQPLVLFLDDVQWADPASLQLLKKTLLIPAQRRLLIIAAYRDTEMPDSHPFSLIVDEVKQQGMSVSAIMLGNLRGADLDRLVQHSLRCSATASASLSALVYQKTLGNPFFTRQLLHTLADEELLRFDFTAARWVWDLEQLQARSITDNVVELLGAKLHRLPAAVSRVLQLAACIGDRFDLATLAIVSEQPPAAVARALWTAQEEGFIIPLDEQYRLIESADADEALRCRFRFAHDRVQQAAYSLIDGSRRQAVHLTIGQLLLSNADGADLAQQIFDIVNQLNGGRDLIEREPERRRLAELNLQAGRRARAAAAYSAALDYFRTGLRLLPPQPWRDAYPLALALHAEAGAAAYLSGELRATLDLAATALAQARDVMDQAPIYEAMIHAFNAQRQPKQAVETALAILRLLGMSFPDQPGPAEIGAGFEQTARTLAAHPLDELSAMPVMADPRKRAAMRIIASVADAAYHAAPALLPLLVCEQVRLSVRDGLAPESAVGFALYGLMLCGILDDIETGQRFGRLALAVLDQFEADEHRAMTLLVVYNNILPWSVHPADCLPHLLESYQRGLETGDLTFAAVAAHAYCYHALFIGKPLDELLPEMAAYDQAIAKLGQQGFLNYHRMYYQAAFNLADEVADPRRLQGPIYDQAEMATVNEASQDITALFVAHFNQCVLAYLFQDYAGAVAEADLAAQYAAGAVALIHLPILCFYDSLARLALAAETPDAERAPLLERVVANQARLQHWAAHAPANHQHKCDLVAAEQARLAGLPWQAAQLYEQASAGARLNHYVQEEALAYEAAARFYLEAGMERLARSCLLDAYERYRRWQATAKLRDLARRYPQWLAQPRPEQTAAPHMPTLLAAKTTTHLGLTLDLAAVMKALSIISGELVLERLLAQVMHVVLENAGAEKGLLVLHALQVQPAGQPRGPVGQAAEADDGFDPDDPWVIQAEAAQGVDEVKVLAAAPIAAALPRSVVDYVVRTSSAVVLEDAANDGQFARDSYFRTHRSRSVLCLPLLNQGRLIGIIYLENTLAPGAFTHERLAVLNLLAAQLAISLDNALLYRDVQQHRDHLEELVAERTMRLETALAETTRLFAEAETAKAAAEAASRAKGDFLANMSHELRTPLNAVLGFSQLLQRDPHLTFAQAESVRLINRSGEHLLKLINDVLELSKIEAGRLTLHESAFDLERLLDDMALMFRLRAEEKGLALRCERAPDMPRSIRGDEGKLRQILINLLGNAVKFTVSGAVTIRIRHAPSADHERPMRLHIEIADTGPGIAPDELAQLFEPFVQAEAGRRAQQGTGLGLALSRRLARAMDGDLSVQSAPGRGATFLFEVPVRPAASDAVRSTAPARRVIALAPGQAAYRLLIVDDTPEDRLLLRRLLEPIGFVIEEAAHGQEAIALCERWRPDLIWMDLRMPVLDGCEATRRIKASPGGQDISIIGVAASSFAEERRRIVEAGCDDVVHKPLQEAMIFAALEQHLGVRFVYAEQAAGEQRDGAAVQLSPSQLTAAIAALPEAWSAALRAATIGCDLGRMLELIDQVRAHAPTLAEALRGWADQFEYEQILAALDPA